MNKERFADLLRRHEGVKTKPYRDSKGILTIGVGRNLESIGLNIAEIDFLLENDMTKAERLATAAFPWFPRLSEDRQIVIGSLIFNMGLASVLEFRHTLVAIEKGDFDLATAELLNSKWRNDVGNKRAGELASMMKRG